MDFDKKIINSVLSSCLTGYSIYDDDIVKCVTKENRSLLKNITQKEQLKLLCDVITMAYHDGQRKVESDQSKLSEVHKKKSLSDFENIRNEIMKINGIGDTKADKVLEVIKKYLEG